MQMFDAETIPFAQVEFQMSDGTCFAMSDPRRFGRLRLSKAPEKEPPISTMGAVALLIDGGVGERVELNHVLAYFRKLLCPSLGDI